MTEERYYTQYVPGDGWELWECLEDGTHTILATFYNGDEKSCPMAEIVLSFLNAVAAVGEQERKQYPPLTEEEIKPHVDKCNADLQARWEQE